MLHGLPIGPARGARGWVPSYRGVVARRLALPVLAVLTLGLAPYAPEPHVVGKLRWVVGGAVGMRPLDWFDLLLHGAPWLWLLVAVGAELRGGKADAPPRWAKAALVVAVLGALLCVAVAVAR